VQVGKHKYCCCCKSKMEIAKAFLIKQSLLLEQYLVLEELLLERCVQTKGETGYKRYELCINQLNAKLHSA